MECGGWIKVWRKILDSPVFKNNDPHLFKTFMYCLLRANHQESRVLIDGKVITLQAGQFITGRKEASKDLSFKSKMWDRKIEILEKLQILTRQATNRFSIISIINWDTYQGQLNNNDQVNDQVLTKSGPSHDQVLTTDKNIKNNKNNKKIIYSEDFETFYKTYPLRVGKQNAYKQWQILKPDLQVILEALQKQISHKNDLIKNNKFCPEWPHPERWLKNRRWEDEIVKEMDDIDLRLAKLRGEK